MQRGATGGARRRRPCIAGTEGEGEFCCAERPRDAEGGGGGRGEGGLGGQGLRERGRQTDRQTHA